MDKDKTNVWSSLFLAGLILALGSGLAHAAPGKTTTSWGSWLTTPILGYDSSYAGDVIINSGSEPTTIPHSFLSGDPLYGTGSPSMSVFTVGQQVHTGSGVYLDAGITYDFSAVFTQLSGGSASYTYTGSFESDGFWMTWNTPNGGGDGGGVPTLTNADVGQWQYHESYWEEKPGVRTGILESTTDFTVTGAIPEPETYAMLLAGLGLLGFMARRRKLKEVAVA